VHFIGMAQDIMAVAKYYSIKWTYYSSSLHAARMETHQVLFQVSFAVKLLDSPVC
jgi:hypothetical protein